MKLQKKKLKNGMVVLFEKRQLPIVTLSITNKFGAAYETAEIKGIAHLIEHMVFNGTKTRTHEQISSEIEKKGGILNAFTSHDITSFWFKLPSEHLFSGLNILADILNNPLFEKEKFEKEKKVVIEEIKMYHDMPQRHVFDMIEKNLYASPFGDSISGSEKTVSSLTRDFVFDYFKKAYNPKNYIVSIVGNANLNKIVAFLEKNFKPTNSSLTIQPIKKQNSETIEERANIDQANFVFAFHAPLLNEKENYALQLLDSYLANGMSSKLFLKIREEKGLAYAIKSSLNTEKNYSYYSIYVGTTKEGISEVKKIILEEFQKIKTEFTEKDLKEAQQRLIGLKHLSAEDSTNTMNDLVFFELATKAEDYYNYEKNIKSITLKDIQKVSEIKEFSTAIILPK